MEDPGHSQALPQVFYLLPLEQATLGHSPSQEDSSCTTRFVFSSRMEDGQM